MGKIKLIEEPSKCSGCGACVVVCPKSAVRMRPDTQGFLYPEIDENLCISCGKCSSVCSCSKQRCFNTPSEVYAAAGMCSKMVAKSASGGIFASLAESCIQKCGLVTGAVMDCRNSNADVFHLLSGEKTDLVRMQGSKYVHSRAWESYPQIIQALKAGKTVLFSGTPCQVAAIKELTGDPENLLTIDIICHGVPSLQMMNDYLKILSKRLCGEVIGFRFREKSCAKQFVAGIDVCYGRKTRHFLMKSTFLSFYKYFLHGHIYRENCYICPYAKSERISDITIGDYWGIEQCHKQDLESGVMPNRNDWSCVLVNTPKGSLYLKEYGEMVSLYPSRLEWVAQNNQQVKEPTHKTEKKKQLLAVYEKQGYRAMEAAFIKESGGRLRFYWRMVRNLYENNRVDRKNEN